MNKVIVADMRMLYWMYGKAKYDKIINDNIREFFEIAPIVENMVENKFRWFKHVEKSQTSRGRGGPINKLLKKILKLMIWIKIWF